MRGSCAIGAQENEPFHLAGGHIGDFDCKRKLIVVDLAILDLLSVESSVLGCCLGGDCTELAHSGC